MLTRPKQISAVYSPVMKEQYCCSCCVRLCDCLCVHEIRTRIIENEKRNKAAVTAFRWSMGTGLRTVCVFVCVNMCSSSISGLLHLVFIRLQMFGCFCILLSACVCLCETITWMCNFCSWENMNESEVHQTRRSMCLFMPQGYAESYSVQCLACCIRPHVTTLR